MGRILSETSNVLEVVYIQECSSIKIRRAKLVELARNLLFYCQGQICFIEGIKTVINIIFFILAAQLTQRN